MPGPEYRRPSQSDDFDLNDEAFIESFLKEVNELAEDAGDWRDHLAYEARVGYHRDSRMRERCRDHFTACAYCQEVAQTLSPGHNS